MKQQSVSCLFARFSLSRHVIEHLTVQEVEPGQTVMESGHLLKIEWLVLHRVRERGREGEGEDKGERRRQGMGRERGGRREGWRRKGGRRRRE